MSDTYLEEVKSALNKDETRLGDVYRRPEKNPKQIAEELGLVPSWVGFVYAFSDIHKSNCGWVCAKGSIDSC